MQNFKELFVYYNNVLAFYCFFKIQKKSLVENIQDRTELMFDMDENHFKQNPYNWAKTHSFSKT